jgi:hypothetical protein
MVTTIRQPGVHSTASSESYDRILESADWSFYIIVNRGSALSIGIELKGGVVRTEAASLAEGRPRGL